MLAIRTVFVFCLALSSVPFLSAQRIVYSDYEKDDSRRMPFEVAGKISGNFMVYKNTKNKHWIVMFDNDMQQVAKVEQDYIPNNDKVINIDFFPYADFCYMIYQYQRKNVVYCMASRVDGKGNKIGEVIQLDTSHIGFSANNSIYTAITSEDKGRIGVFKINSRNKKLFLMTTFLYDDNLQLLKRSRLEIPMEERTDNLGDFSLDNDGDMVFCKFFRNSNDNISRAALMIKYAQADALLVKEIGIAETQLDELHIKVDNANKRYFLASLFYKEKKGNIDGFYFFVWDKPSTKQLYESTYSFSDELRKEARGDATMRMAFNDFFIRQIITRRDGGFIIGSESFYTTSRFNNWNRWNYLYNSPFYSPYSSTYYSPYFNSSYWNNRYSNSQSVRYHADNLAIFSFNGKAQLEWSNVIGKSQFSDESDDVVSYQMVNTGGQLHFLFNMQERRNNLLTDFSVSPGGELTRNPTLKNLDKGHEFMPKYGKQVSARQMIIPCIYRNYICFAKVDYN
ncbi:MAG TPA: hypothetical protein VMZ03_10055 [Chitinophagaceae bacterium]|nr:hypothetical protein [Chitinophagaceae bacterium]